MTIRLPVAIGFLLVFGQAASARWGYARTLDGKIFEGHVRFESNAVVVVNAAKELWVEVPLSNMVALSLDVVPVTPSEPNRPLGRLPEPWLNDDVGSVARNGGAIYVSGGFRLQSAGTNVVASGDSFHFVYKEVEGASEIVARVTKVQFTDPWARAGLMMRESLSPGARSVFHSVSAARGGVCHWREISGEDCSISLDGLMSVPCWLKVRREGDVFTAFKSSNGKSWSLVERVTMRASRRLFVGMAAVSMREGMLGQSVFEQVEESPSVRNRWFTPKIGLQSGSTSVGYLSSVDDVSASFDIADRRDPIPTPGVANILFQPASPRQMMLFGSGRTGALLVTGEFIDGECRQIRGSKMTISSVPLGLCHYDVNSDVVAVVLRKRATLTRHPFEVRTSDGSTWLALEVTFDSSGVLLREPVLGLRRIPAHEIAEFRRRT